MKRSGCESNFCLILLGFDLMLINLFSDLLGELLHYTLLGSMSIAV